MGDGSDGDFDVINRTLWIFYQWTIPSNILRELRVTMRIVLVTGRMMKCNIYDITNDDARECRTVDGDDRNIYTDPGRRGQWPSSQRSQGSRAAAALLEPVSGTVPPDTQTTRNHPRSSRSETLPCASTALSTPPTPQTDRYNNKTLLNVY